MEFSFPWPVTNGEWLAAGSASFTALLGLVMFFAPTLSLRALRLRPSDTHPEALSEARSTIAGFYIGIGICCVFLGQPLLYLALGASWLLALFGRVVSMLSDGGNTLYNWVFLALQLVLAILPLGYFFGFVS